MQSRGVLYEFYDTSLRCQWNDFVTSYSQVTPRAFTDMKDSMSFYRPIDEKKKNELQIVTKLFDPERDYRMARFCGYLIHHLVFYRRLSMKFPSDADKISENIEIRGFSIEDIKVWSKVNVELQDIVETITKM